MLHSIALQECEAQLLAKHRGSLEFEVALSCASDELVSLYYSRDYEKYVGFFQHRSDVLGDSPPLLILHIKALIALDRYESAASKIRQSSLENLTIQKILLTASEATGFSGKFAETQDYIEKFLESVHEKPNSAELTTLLRLADRCFDTGGKNLALRLYELASSNHFSYSLGILRQSEILVDKGEYEAANLLLSSIADHLDEWGLCVLASAEAKTGGLSKAVERFVQISSKLPNVDHFWHRWFEFVVLASNERDTSWTTFSSLLKVYRPELLDLFSFKLDVMDGNFARASELFKLSSNISLHGAKWDFIDFLYKSIGNFPEEGVRSIEEHCLASFPDSPEVYKPIIDRACHQQDWERAELVLAAAEARGLAGDDVELAIKRFELACFLGDVERAGHLLSAAGPISDLPDHLVNAVYRYLAEIGEWSKIIADFSLRLGGGYSPAGVENTIIRAARKSGEQEGLLRKLLGSDAISNSKPLSFIRSVLAQDTIYATSGKSLAQSRKVVAEHLLKSSSGVIKRRVEAEENIRRFYEEDTQSRSDKKVALYFCTNRSYLCGAATALFSLLLNNPLLGLNADCFVVAEEPDVQLVIDSFEPIAEAFDINITVVSEQLIVNSDADLRGSYGLFTGGAALAKAAYYRIYFVQYLLDKFDYDHALYLDSDVVVNPGLDDLLRSVDMHAAVYARLEVDKPEVRRAISQHGLKPNTYFNSGVLLFNLKHDDLRNCLKMSIDAAETRSDALLFHDQCALNIGFAGKHGSLDARFNFFIDPHIGLLDPEGAYFAPVLHFLDRPKPWDASYTLQIGLTWLYQWQKLCTILPPEIAQLLYAAAARS